MTDFTPGDVVEITTNKGKAYVQVTHIHSSYPPVVRALGGLHDSRPGDLDALVGEVVEAAASGDRIVVMSNGGFGGIHGKLLQALEARHDAR